MARAVRNCAIGRLGNTIGSRDLAALDYNDIAVTAQLRVKSFPNANVI